MKHEFKDWHELKASLGHIVSERTRVGTGHTTTKFSAQRRVICPIDTKTQQAKRQGWDKGQGRREKGQERRWGIFALEGQKTASE